MGNISTVKPVLNGPFSKRNFALNGHIFRSRDYNSIPWLNGNVASAEEMFWTLEILFKTGLLYFFSLKAGLHTSKYLFPVDRLVRSVTRLPLHCIFRSWDQIERESTSKHVFKGKKVPSIIVQEYYVTIIFCHCKPHRNLKLCQN
jgi:hypothetical protein